jgi:hypothetical protein
MKLKKIKFIDLKIDLKIDIYIYITKSINNITFILWILNPINYHLLYIKQHFLI